MPRTPAKKTAATRPPAKSAKKGTKVTSTPKRTPAAAKKSVVAAKKSPVTKKKAVPAPAKKKAAAIKAAPAKKTAPAAKTAPPAVKKKAPPPAPVRKAAAPAPVKKAAPAVKKAAPPVQKAAPAPPARPVVKKKVVFDKFMLEQKAQLEEERAGYVAQAEALKAEADQLAQEMDPSDVQFDEESGEGGTANIDRERDLILSAQARLAVEDIDQALGRLNNGTYGLCERCGHQIPKPRLKAIPHASLCVACKSGGLSRR